MAKLSAVGLEMGIAIGLGWWAGNWADGKLGTKPWLMIVGLLLGTAAGFKGMIEAARQAHRK